DDVQAVVEVRVQAAAGTVRLGTRYRPADLAFLDEVVEGDADVVGRRCPVQVGAGRRQVVHDRLAGLARRLGVAVAEDLELLQGVPVAGVGPAPLGPVHPHVPTGRGDGREVVHAAVAVGHGLDRRPGAVV